MPEAQDNTRKKDEVDERSSHCGASLLSILRFIKYISKILWNSSPKQYQYY